MEEQYNVKLAVFEGPLDLLLHLIRENKVDIYDIPISFITGQYLEYLGIMKELDLEIAGEFLVMAATLIHIKSRMLLPVDETAEPEEFEDPRLELVQRLLEYQTYKDAALVLRDMEEDAARIFGRDAAEIEEREKEAELYLFDVNIFDLLSALKRVIDAAPPEIRTITREKLTVKDKMLMIAEMLEHTESVRFEELFRDNRTKEQIIVTFLALLELLRLGLSRVYQEREFGNIWVIKPRKETVDEKVEIESIV
jgi:segregation and condensation protein A